MAIAGVLLLITLGAVIVGGCIYSYRKFMESRQMMKSREAQWESTDKYYDDIFIKGVN